MPHVERPSAAIYYEVCGNGPPLVFAHGAGGNTLVWWQQVPYFAGRHRVVTFDHRGFGRSRCARGHEQARHFADDLAAVLDAAGIERCALVCQSMGGWTGLQLALAHPRRVAALVLSGTPAGIATPGVVAALRAIAAASAAAELAAPAWNQPHVALAADLFARDPTRAFLYEQLAALNPADALARSALHEVMTDPAHLVGWRIPTLLIGGSEDRLFSPAVLREVAAAIPGATFEEIPVAGHSPYFETPERFNALVGGFVQAVP
ncbi:alpha/beta fold hydrolase [bacterium]|nr:alpha/beta fold hydrolase [bacterium]